MTTIGDKNNNRIDSDSAVDFSIILINFNSASYIDLCLEHVRKSVFSGTSEIIVVNNLATDGSMEILQNQPDIKILDPRKNLGFSGGNNLGICISQGRYILCLNFDCLLTENFLQHVYNALETYPMVGMVSGKLRKLNNLKPTMYLDSTGIEFARFIPADRGEWQYDVGQYDLLTDIFGPSGAAGCYRRKALETVAYRDDQYFDEQMFTYCEDIDLAWRLNLAGWHGLYVPYAVAYHERGATRKESFGKKVAYRLNGISNRYFTILKNARQKDIRGRLKKLILQELRIHAASNKLSPIRWITLIYVFLRLGTLWLQPSFFAKRKVAHRWNKNNHIDLALGTELYEALCLERTKHPINISFDWHIKFDEKIVIDKLAWRATCGGFRNTKWNSAEYFFSGYRNQKKPYIDISIPEKYQSKLKYFHLYVDLNTATDILFELQITSNNGKVARSDWCVFSGGKGLFKLDLEKTNLLPSPNNIAIWQGIWAKMRLNFSTKHNHKINIRKIFFHQK